VDNGGFRELGWSPEGEPYFNYKVVAEPGGCPAPGNPCSSFTAEAASDLDGDGTLNFWGYVHPDATGSAPNASFCLGTGTWDVQAGTADALKQVGPCDANMGTAVFRAPCAWQVCSAMGRQAPPLRLGEPSSPARRAARKARPATLRPERRGDQVRQIMTALRLLAEERSVSDHKLITSAVKELRRSRLRSLREPARSPCSAARARSARIRRQQAYAFANAGARAGW
jgi:hypothetical protein